MKKFTGVIIGSILLIIGLLIGLNINKTDAYEEENVVPEVTHKNMLSMMLEQNAGAGDYSLETRSSWPTKDDGYIFNSTLSKCEKGSKLRWDDENNAVVMVGTTSDKCYVYFDVYVEPTITLADYVKSLYTGTQGENNLYYHDTSLTNGAGDNSYRYAGAHDEVNNFVCFGSDAATCPDDNLYRIIGVFGNQVKLIKWDYATSILLGTDGDYIAQCSADSTCNYSLNNGRYKGTNNAANIGTYFWNGNGTNTWSTSELNTVNLNTNFLGNIGSTWASKIATTKWIVGGNTWANIGAGTPASAYENEITNPADNTIYVSKISLMYINDFGFATNPSTWTANLDTIEIFMDNNWLFMGLNEWLVVRNSDDTTSTFCVSRIGTSDYSVVDSSEPTFAVRPVFYLNSNVTKVGDNIGSKTNPIRID